MNITKNQIDDLNAVIKINIQEEDYQSRVEKVIKDYRQKASVPGFRPGKVPSGLIKKLYGKQILAEEINKILSEELYKYLGDSKLNILGEPLSSEQEQKEIDFENNSEFEFAFDIGLAPEFETTLSKKDKIDYFIINPDDEMIEKQIENHCNRFGKYIEVEKVVEKEHIRGNFVELKEDGNIADDGINVEDTSFLIETISNEKIKKDIIGKKVNDTVQFKIKEAFENDTDIASMLKIDKKKAENIDSEFKFTIAKISKWEVAEVNQELFNSVYGEDKVKSVEEFKENITEDLKKNLEVESNYKFFIDTREKLINKFDFELPDEFLKRFLLKTSKDEALSQEKLNEEYPKYREQFKWELIKSKIVKENEIKIEDAEIQDYARKMVQSHFMNYGMSYVPEEYLENYSKEVLGNNEEKNQIIEKIYEDKAVAFVKETVKLNEKEVSTKEFNKLLEKSK